MRGAPLIAVVGALGLLAEISDLEFKSSKEFMEFVRSKVSGPLCKFPLNLV